MSCLFYFILFFLKDMSCLLTINLSFQKKYYFITRRSYHHYGMENSTQNDKTQLGFSFLGVQKWVSKFRVFAVF